MLVKYLFYFITLFLPLSCYAITLPVEVTFSPSKYGFLFSENHQKIEQLDFIFDPISENEQIISVPFKQLHQGKTHQFNVTVGQRKRDLVVYLYVLSLDEIGKKRFESWSIPSTTFTLPLYSQVRSLHIECYLDFPEVEACFNNASKQWSSRGISCHGAFKTQEPLKVAITKAQESHNQVEVNAQQAQDFLTALASRQTTLSTTSLSLVQGLVLSAGPGFCGITQDKTARSICLGLTFERFTDIYSQYHCENFLAGPAQDKIAYSACLSWRLHRNNQDCEVQKTSCEIGDIDFIRSFNRSLSKRNHFDKLENCSQIQPPQFVSPEFFHSICVGLTSKTAFLGRVDYLETYNIWGARLDQELREAIGLKLNSDWNHHDLKTIVESLGFKRLVHIKRFDQLIDTLNEGVILASGYSGQMGAFHTTGFKAAFANLVTEKVFQEPRSIFGRGNGRNILFELDLSALNDPAALHVSKSCPGGGFVFPKSAFLSEPAHVVRVLSTQPISEQNEVLFKGAIPLKYVTKIWVPKPYLQGVLAEIHKNRIPNPTTIPWEELIQGVSAEPEFHPKDSEWK
jgi:hypothetical protein